MEFLELTQEPFFGGVPSTERNARPRDRVITGAGVCLFFSNAKEFTKKRGQKGGSAKQNDLHSDHLSYFILRLFHFMLRSKKGSFRAIIFLTTHKMK